MSNNPFQSLSNKIHKRNEGNERKPQNRLEEQLTERVGKGKEKSLKG